MISFKRNKKNSECTKFIYSETFDIGKHKLFKNDEKLMKESLFFQEKNSP